MQKVTDYTLKMKKPTDRRNRNLTFYRSIFFKMPLFLSYNSSKNLVPNQGSVEIIDPDRVHIMLSFPYKFLFTSIKKDQKVDTFFTDLKIDLKLLLTIIIIEIDL